MKKTNNRSSKEQQNVNHTKDQTTTTTATTNAVGSSRSSSTNSQSNSSNGNIVVLPDSLTPSERRQTVKAWRPTLIPITTGSGAMLNPGGPLYQTADGRKLPALVQVMSGGNPYHISIHDYNRMCILRREKLQQQLSMKQRQQQHQQHQQNLQTLQNQQQQLQANSMSSNIVATNSSGLTISSVTSLKDMGRIQNHISTPSTSTASTSKHIGNRNIISNNKHYHH